MLCFGTKEIKLNDIPAPSEHVSDHRMESLLLNLLVFNVLLLL